MSNTDSAPWLTQEAYDRLKRELLLEQEQLGQAFREQ